MIALKQSCAFYRCLVVIVMACCQFAPTTPTESPDCEPWDCGTNTPNLYHAVIDVVSLKAPAAPVPAGFPVSKPYVEQGSLKVDNQYCPNATAATHLGVHDGELVGMNSRLDALCTGADLTNARFTVRAGTRSLDVLVRSVGKVFTWERDETKRRSVTTYRFAGRYGQAVCKMRAWMEDWQIANLRPSMWRPGFPQKRPTDAQGHAIELPAEPAGVPPKSWATPTDEAVLYQGETYARDAEIAQRGDQWINIGCAGSGIAKMRLMGFNPMATGAGDTPNRKSTEEQRVATAKMITARYQGRKSYTEQGMPLLWLQWNGINYYGDPLLGDAAIGQIESHWRAHGAQCLSHLRWARQCCVTPGEEAAKWTEVALGSCAGSDPSSTETAYQNGSDKSIWTTFTYTHVAHP